MTGRHDPTAFAVAVPACDEAATVRACIASLDRAAGMVHLPVHLVVVADRCTDDTARLAREALAASRSLAGRVVEIDEGSAGAARESAARLAVADVTSSGHRIERLWLATTDADSAVDPDWLVRHRRWAGLGLAGVSGLVRLGPDADGPTRHRYERFVASRGTSTGHGHVHGANLGLRAEWWSTVGGFPALRTGEDQALWQRLRAAGADVLGVTDLGVTTSARLDGRAPNGLADLLAALSA